MEVAVGILCCPLWAAVARAGSQQEGWIPAAEQQSVPSSRRVYSGKHFVSQPELPKQVFCLHLIWSKLFTHLDVPHNILSWSRCFSKYMHE